MSYFLDNHPHKYDLSLDDIFLSISTLLSGAPYAKRHWELSFEGSPNYVWGHRAIAVLEALPVMGAANSLLERVAFILKESLVTTSAASKQDEAKANDLSEIIEVNNSRFWKPRDLSWDEAYKHMWKNSLKAIQEHFKSHPEVYMSEDSGIPSLGEMIKYQPLSPLNFQTFVSVEQGEWRNSMEDAHFIVDTEEYLLMGIFDGHGGHEVSQHACQLFKERFQDKLNAAQGNPHQAFEQLFYEIHEEVTIVEDWKKIGSTAVVTYINKSNHRIYTATLGDSEANIYRNTESGVKSLPLSVVRHWASNKDLERLSYLIGVENNDWTENVDPKDIRYMGVNVSRALGDVERKGTSEMPGIIQKPKITMQLLLPGDILVLACDGLKDYVNEAHITTMIAANKDIMGLDLTRMLMKHTLKFSKDNVSIIAVKAI